MKKIYLLMLAGLFTLALGSCSEDELDKELLGNNPGTLLIEDHFGEIEESSVITHKGE